MKLSFKESLITLITVAIIMLSGIILIGMPVSVILLIEVVFVSIIALFKKIPYDELQATMLSSISAILSPILILLMVGALVSSWIIGGTVPALIHLGLKIIDARFFYAICFVMCSVTSMVIGTSWGTISTLGMAFMGISNGLGLFPAYTVGAIVSGAILGDKMSPLSSSMVLAAELSKVPLREGIKATALTNVPAFVFSLLVYFYFGLSSGTYASGEIAETRLLLDAISSEFTIGILPLLPPVMLLILMVLKVPTIPTFVIGIAMGTFEGVLIQGRSLGDVTDGLMNGYSSENEVLSSLLHHTGMNGMASILSMMIFAAALGGIIKQLGIITCLLEKIFAHASSKGSIITSSVLIHIICFVVTGNYFATNSILAPAFTDLYDEKEIPRGTITSIFINTGTGISPLIPWGPTALFVASSLGFTSLSYCIYSPILWLPVLLHPVFAYWKNR